MNLFDDFLRTDDSPRRNVDSNFDFLNRSARPEFVRIREQLERWFRNYPEPAQANLAGRFRSRDDRAHEGAQFELLMHAFLGALTGHAVSVSTASPDFVAGSDQDTFCVEATVVAPRNGVLSDPPLEAAVFDVINAMPSPNFQFWVDVKGTLDRAPARAAILGPLLDFMGRYDPDVVQAAYDDGAPLPTIEVPIGGWCLTATLMPKSADSRGKPGRTIGGGPMRSGFVDDATPLRDAIVKKAAQFRESVHPYVVAVNGLGHHDRTDEIDALFGKERISIRVDDPNANAESIRERNSVWVLGPRARARHVSAVLVCRNLAPWSLHAESVHLYVNPYVDVRLPAALLRIPHTIGERGVLKSIAGQSVGEILGLDPHWIAT